jgi:iron complex outermembrane recepter protein
MRKNCFLGATALQTAALVAVAMSSMPAMAQDDPVEQEEAQEAAPAEGEPVILVVGSRIGRVTPFNSPDPISVIDPVIASREGKFDLASTLQSSPIAAGSTQITSALSSNFVTAGGPGAQTIDLRGLGPNRTLVLLNGRRARQAACCRSGCRSTRGPSAGLRT